jgi:protein HIRA/HIR1
MSVLLVLLPAGYADSNATDVADLAWSADNTYLASTGMDLNVLIWDTKRFSLPSSMRALRSRLMIFFFFADRDHSPDQPMQPLKRLIGHHQFVKGLTWDPAGKFLASEVN